MTPGSRPPVPPVPGKGKVADQLKQTHKEERTYKDLPLDADAGELVAGHEFTEGPGEGPAAVTPTAAPPAATPSAEVPSAEVPSESFVRQALERILPGALARFPAMGNRRTYLIYMLQQEVPGLTAEDAAQEVEVALAALPEGT